MAFTAIRQRNSSDCGVAALAMLLGASYATVHRATIAEIGTVTRGLWARDLERVAARLDYAIRRVARRRDYLADAQGVLGVLGKELAPGGHWVYYDHGLIVDPLGPTIWRSGADYLLQHQARPATLLVRHTSVHT